MHQPSTLRFTLVDSYQAWLPLRNGSSYKFPDKAPLLSDFPKHDPIEAKFLGEGSFHRAYRFTLSAGHPLIAEFMPQPIEETFEEKPAAPSAKPCTFVVKIPKMQKRGIGFVRKEAASFVHINNKENLYTEAVAIKVGSEIFHAEIFPFIAGQTVTQDIEFARAVKYFYQNSRFGLLDALSPGNVIRNPQGQFICVDAGCAVSESKDNTPLPQLEFYAAQWARLLYLYPKTISMLLSCLFRLDHIGFGFFENICNQVQARVNELKALQGQEKKTCQGKIEAYENGLSLVRAVYRLLARNLVLAERDNPERTRERTRAERIGPPVKRGRPAEAEAVQVYSHYSTPIRVRSSVEDTPPIQVRRVGHTPPSLGAAFSPEA